MFALDTNSKVLDLPRLFVLSGDSSTDKDPDTIRVISSVATNDFAMAYDMDPPVPTVYSKTGAITCLKPLKLAYGGNEVGGIVKFFGKSPC